jgi:hypothetical protein
MKTVANPLQGLPSLASGIGFLFSIVGELMVVDG